jgi:hypothetical protein
MGEGHPPFFQMENADFAHGIPNAAFRQSLRQLLAVAGSVPSTWSTLSRSMLAKSSQDTTESRFSPVA